VPGIRLTTIPSSRCSLASTWGFGNVQDRWGGTGPLLGWLAECAQRRLQSPFGSSGETRGRRGRLPPLSGGSQV
jgi:hypothetical protein